MKVMLIIAWEGVTREQYDEVKSKVNWEGNVAPGAVLHVASFDDKGLRITDVWESEEDFTNFLQNRLMPVIQEMGITTQPKSEIYPLHDIFTPGV
jgi:hypothetical protein